MHFEKKSKTNVLRKLFVGAAILGASISLSSCLDNLDSPDLPPAAYVSIYQGSSSAPAMDVFANQNRVNQNPINYAEVLPYSAFYPGSRGFRFSAYNSATSLLEKNFTLKADSVYSVFLADKQSGIDAIFVKDVWNEPTAEKAQLRFVHLSPDSDAVYLEISGSTTPLIPAAAFKQVTNFKEIPKGNFTIRVKSSQTNEVLIQTGTLELKGNRVYTLILRGLRSETTGSKKLDLQLVTNYFNY